MWPQRCLFGRAASALRELDRLRAVAGKGAWSSERWSPAPSGTSTCAGGVMNWKDSAKELEFESREELKAVACGCSCTGRAEEQ